MIRSEEAEVMEIPTECGSVTVLFEDDHLIVTVKPAGMPTANAPAGRPSLYTWLKARLGHQAFVGVVSRLDAAVSGVVVSAKTPRAAAILSEQFRERSVEKLYTAIVAGRFPAAIRTWVEWTDGLQRPPGQQATRTVPPGTKAAQDATTRGRVIVRAGELSLVELAPVTGRRHQLRAQLGARGCPIVGDRLYGSRLPFPLPGGIGLHATQITFEHPIGAAPVTFESTIPEVWRSRYPHLFSES
jgi:23S rRNA pseudouridine1911/1915/1917 synthase